MSANEYILGYNEPARSSDEGLPVANGLMGALVWGDGDPLNISLDRTDLWDLREVPAYSRDEYRWSKVVDKHHAGEHDELIELLEKPYYRPGPTKILAGRIEVRFPSGAGQFQNAELPVRQPVGRVVLGRTTVDTWLHPQDNVGYVSIVGGAPTFTLCEPPFGSEPEGWERPSGFDASIADVWELGYPPPQVHSTSNSADFLQKGHDGFSFAVALVWKQKDDRTLATWSIATSDESDDVLTLAKRRAADALNADYDSALADHRGWWKDYWHKSRVELPDPIIAHGYHLDMYKFGAAARRGVPPISLQGPWTVDNGRLPPWKGDYHHNLNTQMSYWPAYTGNRLDAGLGFLDWLWDTREECRAWTRQFFEVDGICVPMTADLKNRQIGGWRQYAHSLSSGAWLAWHFHMHWRHSMDRSFLEHRGYPYLAEICTFIEAISEQRDNDGKRSIALSCSPEINDNRPEAWTEQITNYDLVLFTRALEIAAEFADELGDKASSEHWRKVASEFPPLAIAPDGLLLVAPGQKLERSHRHFSHMMGLFPLDVIDPRRSARDRDIARVTLAQIEELGTDWWMGYSFAWKACLHARCGEGAEAAKALHAYADGFLLKNSFHANGDFADKGYAKAVFRAFTLEGNFAAAQAIHEMLLQSHNGILHLFPAIPADWQEVSFTGLLAEGGVEVDASVKGGELFSVTMRSNNTQELVLAFASNMEGGDVALTGGDPLHLTRAQLDRMNGVPS